MKKIVITFVTACMLLTAGTAAYAAAPVTAKKHEQKMHAKSVHKKVKMHAKSKKMKSKLHAKSLKAKAITKMPKTGFGGASEQSE
jgi:opacity protein-like surface antigen